MASESLLTVFASLWALRKGSTGQIDGTCLAHALQRLLRTEVSPGGPYVDADRTVSPLANAAIALFLHGEGVHLPALEPFIAQFEPADLQQQLQAAAAPHVTRVPRTKLFRPASDQEALLAGTNTRVHAAIAAWPEPLAATGEQVFAELLRADKTGEIRQMPQLFASSLVVPSKVRRNLFVLLGTANVFFWMGGMILDDFLDEEGKPELLPIATASHRQALALYRQVTAGQPEFYQYIEASCLSADRANAWEIAHARAQVVRGVIRLPKLPDYGNYWALADRSIGHLFGPLLIAHQLQGITDVQLAQIEQGLRHYLVVRQLNDDIYDWRKDLGAGQLSAVVVELLRGAGIRSGNHRLATITPKIEQYFMAEGLQRVCDLLQEQVNLARQSLTASGLVAATGGLEDLITRQEANMRAALKTHADYQQFLAAFTP